MFNLLCVAAALAAAPVATDPAWTEVAPGVHLLPGAFVPGAQPDGNTVVLRGKDGLVVVDTGRHAAHTERIVALARAQGLPVRAIVNTHWHLDHVSGNPAVRAAFPGAETHASDAIRAAAEGFLADYGRQLDEVIAKGGDEAAVSGFRAEKARIDAAATLFPDRVVDAPGARTLAGRDVRLGLVRAATQGDVWLYDAASRVLVVGDLVTLPAPFFDTACPSRWQAALAALEDVPFTRLVPGHGPALTRDEFRAYRAAFDALLACGASERPQAECASGWIEGAGALVPATEHAFTRQMIGYYLEAHLRDAARTQKLCG